MRRNVLLPALLLGLLIFVPPAFAVSISGSAFLDWSGLTMTGIDFALSDFRQIVNADVSTLNGGSASSFTGSNDWLSATASATLPSVGSATANASNSELNSSFSLFSDRAFAGGGVQRWGTITALTTGFLTISIPYQVQIHGPTFGEWSAAASAFIQFTNPNGTGGIADGGFLEYLNGNKIPVIASGPTPTGMASLTIPFSQGQVGLLNFSARGGASVPGPETFWSFAIGLILLGLVHRRMTSRAQPHVVSTLQRAREHF
jgi:hypothetical protein